ncbi:MAG: hypothetical protein ABIH39_06220, partial [Candidatus Margulisiibacteriota bacterium]
TVFASLISREVKFPEVSGDLFHIFHPVHMLFSATATTAMFWRHDRRLIKAIVIGLIGAIGVCGVSDIILPFVAGLLLGAKMHLHICIIAHPAIVIPFALTGVFAGLLVRTETNIGTISSHSAHVLVSSMASLLYLISYGVTDWMESIGYVFLFVIAAVMIPCCFSDIIFPLLFAKPRKPEIFTAD